MKIQDLENSIAYRRHLVRVAQAQGRKVKPSTLRLLEEMVHQGRSTTGRLALHTKEVRTMSKFNVDQIVRVRGVHDNMQVLHVDHDRGRVYVRGVCDPSVVYAATFDEVRGISPEPEVEPYSCVRLHELVAEADASHMLVLDPARDDIRDVVENLAATYPDMKAVVLGREHALHDVLDLVKGVGDDDLS